MILENINRVKQQMKIACENSGRDLKEVTLIAVSKTKPLPMLQEAYDYGIRDFGENKVQEILDKYDAMPNDVKWHMIGHLQRNKVKFIVDKVYLIHSVDSLRLAEEISHQAILKNVNVNILVEINIAKEETKFGATQEDAVKLVENIAKLPNIFIKGLMTIAPNVENPEENRYYFATLREISVDILKKNIDNVNMSVLSMGMSNDYKVAIEEGASYIRVGTSIFGDRIVYDGI